MAGHKRCRCRFPLRMHKTGPCTHSKQIFEELKQVCEPTPPQERQENNWIQPATWAMVDARVGMKKQGLLTQQLTRKLGRQIKAALNKDRGKRAADVAKEIEAKLAAGEMQEAWKLLKGWYHAAEDRPPKPCHASMTW